MKIYLVKLRTFQSIGYEADFDVILNQQHKVPVICADTAVNNPVHATCSSRTLILWDYQKRLDFSPII